MDGPANSFTKRISLDSGPKLPRKTTKALHPASFTSFKAFLISFSFSTVV